MDITNGTLQVDDAIQGHSSQFEEIHFLTIELCDMMLRVGQAAEGKFLAHPKSLEGICRVGPDCKNLYAPRLKLFVLVAQTRQLRAAVRSHKAAQKSKQDDLLTAEACKADAISVNIFEFKIRRKRAGENKRVHCSSK